MHACVLSRVRLFETPWTVARQTPLSMEFSRQESWSGLPFPSPGDIPDPGTEPVTPTSPTPHVVSLLLEPLEKPHKSMMGVYSIVYSIFQTLPRTMKRKSCQLKELCNTASKPTLLLLRSHFSRVRLCETSSLGFSRQEHWSGLPFPSPMHKSEKWKWSRSVSSNSSRPHGLQPTRLLRPWDFPGNSTGVGCHCLLQTYTSPHYLDTDSKLLGLTLRLMNCCCCSC